MKAVKKLVATVGKKADGKNVYQRVGTFFKRDDGTFTVKLDSIPISASWDGWINLYDMDDDKKPAAPLDPATGEVNF